MPVRESAAVLDTRRHLFNETSFSDRRFGRAVDQDRTFVSDREARIAALRAKVAADELAEHGIEPRRGIERPVVLLSSPSPDGGCPVFQSLTKAAATLGVKDCSICEAIRGRRPVRGNVLRYLDQLSGRGRHDGDRFYAQDVSDLMGEREYATIKSLAIAA